MAKAKTTKQKIGVPDDTPPVKRKRGRPRRDSNIVGAPAPRAAKPTPAGSAESVRVAEFCERIQQATPVDVAVYAIAVPTVDISNEGYCTTHADTQLSATQARALKHLTVALDRVGFQLRSGRRCVTPADAVRFLLESIASQLGE